MVEKENEEVVDEKALELAKKISKGEVAVVVSPIHSDEETTRVLGTSAGYGIGASIDILGRALSGKKVRPDELSKVGEFGVNLVLGIGQALSASRRRELGDLIGSLADYTDCAKCKREIEKLVEVVEYLIDDVKLFREHMPERQAVKYKRKESGEYLPLWRKVIGRIL